MTIDYERLKARAFADVVSSYTPKDTMLYALSIGLGSDPVDAGQLRYVYEEDLQAFPTMALVLGDPGYWLQEPDTGIDWKQVLYGDLDLELNAPLSSAGTVIGRTSIEEIVDKGVGRGAILHTQRVLTSAQTGDRLASVRSTYVCRGDGGFGGSAQVSRPVEEQPAGPPDHVSDFLTRPQAALLYRLNGDFNPLHADPAVARVAGFERPILHGLCTFGVAASSLVGAVCGYDSSLVSRIQARFTSPVYPGERLQTEIWHTGPRRAAFRCSVPERGVVVLNGGQFELRPGATVPG